MWSRCLPVLSKWMSIVIEPSVSWAEEKLVVLRAGIPRARHTVKGWK